MLEVVTDAVHRLGRDEWWSSVRDALDGLSPSEVAGYQVESQQVPLHVVVEADDDSGLAVPTAFQAEQVRAVSIARLVERPGRLDPESRHAIDEIVRNALGL
jgi:mRNA-degrading endonuclease toxin of MazEF toxin-antitoxin module